MIDFTMAQEKMTTVDLKVLFRVARATYYRQHSLYTSVFRRPPFFFSFPVLSSFPLATGLDSIGSIEDEQIDENMNFPGYGDILYRIGKG